MKENLIYDLVMIASKFKSLAILQHLAFYIIGVMMVLSGKHYRRIFVLWMSLTCILIGNLSLFQGHNALNILMFWMLGIMLFTETGLIKSIKPSLLEDESEKEIIQKIIGGAGIFFGLIYPHYAKSHFPWTLFSSPFGITPIPTLMVFLSIQIIAYPGIKIYSFAASALIAFLYSLIGILIFGYKYDIILLILSVYAAFLAYINIKNPSQEKKDNKDDFSNIRI